MSDVSARLSAYRRFVITPLIDEHLNAMRSEDEESIVTRDIDLARTAPVSSVLYVIVVDG